MPSLQLLLPDAMATDNLAALSDLTEDIVLQYLQQRYSQDQIYVSHFNAPGTIGLG